MQQNENEYLRDYYRLPETSATKSLFFAFSHSYNEWTTIEPVVPSADSSNPLIKQGTEKQATTWDRIGQGLYLGQIPTKNGVYSHAKSIPAYVNGCERNQPLGLVISLLDYFELAGVGFPIKGTVRPYEWQNLGVEHHLILMTDNTPDAPVELLLKGVFKMREYLEKGKSVYIHCKAGRARSAMLVLIYLAIFGSNQNADLKTIYAQMKGIRSQLDLKEGKGKWLTAEAVINYYRSNRWREQNTENWQKPTTFSVRKLDAILASHKCKDDIRQLTAFKELAIYALKYSKGEEQDAIKELFAAIYNARDAKWYFDLVQSKGPSLVLLKLPKGTEGNIIIENFRVEVNTYLAQLFECSVNDILSVVTSEEITSQASSRPSP